MKYMLNEFSRTALLIGEEALAKLAVSVVAVFGVGGVGSYAVEGLARAGVGNLVLVDNDRVAPSNINRQLQATRATIGRPKVEVMRDRIAVINPQARVEIHQTFYMPEQTADLISSEYDYIIDAIDTVTAKIDLIVNAQRQAIPIISCMGAGNKLDPTKFTIADIYQTSVCPLAKVMRKELRKRGVPAQKVVYSPEPPVKPFAAKASEENNSRRQIPGSISFVPSVAGLILAGAVVKDLITDNYGCRNGFYL